VRFALHAQPVARPARSVKGISHMVDFPTSLVCSFYFQRSLIN
jgi:hypothetical protein